MVYVTPPGSANEETPKKTIAPQDVIAALREVEFEEFAPRVQMEVDAYMENATVKRRGKGKEKEGNGNAKEGVVKKGRKGKDQSLAQNGGTGGTVDSQKQQTHQQQGLNVNGGDDLDDDEDMIEPGAKRVRTENGVSVARQQDHDDDNEDNDDAEDDDIPEDDDAVDAEGEEDAEEEEADEENITSGNGNGNGTASATQRRRHLSVHVDIPVDDLDLANDSHEKRARRKAAGLNSENDDDGDDDDDNNDDDDDDGDSDR